MAAIQLLKGAGNPFISLTPDMKEILPYQLREIRGWLCREEVSRKKRSCEDQIIYFMQLIEDDYQAEKPERTASAIL